MADIVRKFYPRRGKIDPATKTFQAIRIYINDELGELKKILQSSKELLKENGRLVVVSFHSLEDGIVKKFTREESGYKAEKKNKYKKEEDCKKEEFCFTLLTKKPVGPTEEEIKRNPRSRSSRSRAVRKN